MKLYVGLEETFEEGRLEGSGELMESEGGEEKGDVCDG